MWISHHRDFPQVGSELRRNWAAPRGPTLSQGPTQDLSSSSSFSFCTSSHISSLLLPPAFFSLKPRLKQNPPRLKKALETSRLPHCNGRLDRYANVPLLNLQKMTLKVLVKDTAQCLSNLMKCYTPADLVEGEACGSLCVSGGSGHSV